MAVYNKFEQFVEDVLLGVHTFNTDVIKVALCAAANAPVATDSVLADLTEILYTNLVSQTLTVSGVAQVAGVARVFIDDFALEASGGAVATFRYIVLYNDTSAADSLIGWYDYGSDVTLLDTQQLILDFNAVNGAFSIT